MGEAERQEIRAEFDRVANMTPAELDDGDLVRMRKVIGYCHRHLAQRPGGDVTGARWRYSLMSWGTVR